MTQKELANELISLVKDYRSARDHELYSVALLTQQEIGKLITQHAEMIISALEWWDDSLETTRRVILDVFAPQTP